MFWRIQNDSSVRFLSIEMHENRVPIQVQLPYYSARKWHVLSNYKEWRVLSNYIVLLMFKSGLSITNQIRELCYGFD